MDSPDERQEPGPEEPVPPSLANDPQLAARIFRARLGVLVIAGFALAGIVLMCLIVGILIVQQY